MSDQSSSGPGRKKVGVEPRDLPERQDEHGDPFEQLNEASPAKKSDERDPERAFIQPRSLPKHEEETILEAARLMREGKTHEEVAKQLRIEPLKLRRWEKAYSSEFQSDLNEGDYHDTDAQLRDLPEDAKEKFQGNWEQVTEKETERRVKVGPLRAKLMELPATRWLFRNEHGDIDYGTVMGILVAFVVLGMAMRYMNQESENPTAAEDDAGVIVGLNDLTTIVHDPDAAAKIIIAFHRTKTWEEKLAYVNNPEKVRPLMAKWYTKHPEDVTIEKITFAMDQPIEEGNRNFLQVGLSVGDLGRYFVMAVELMEDKSYKIDWETSSGYQEISFNDLMIQKPTEPVELRLTVESANFFNFGFTDDLYYAFKGTYLGVNQPIFIYIKKDHPDAQSLFSTLQIFPSKGVIVKVRYPENAKVDDQLELIELVADSWFRKYTDS
ncbi:MAG: hypothetical protein ACI8T1_001980 [Verrucomicrobiales bacterium]|jgi:hypothetical protein